MSQSESMTVPGHPFYRLPMNDTYNLAATTTIETNTQTYCLTIILLWDGVPTLLYFEHHIYQFPTGEGGGGGKGCEGLPNI